MKNVGKKIVTVVLGILMLLVVSLLSACQTDIVGPSFSTKLLYKGENGNNEWKSRNAGMTGSTGYHSWTLGNFGKDN